MRCTDEDKTTLGAYMLREEANHWWKNARQRIGAGGVVVEFLELKQGNMTVAEYTAKFESLSAFSPYYNTPEA
ncbi:hypothetical protein A2U01_0062150, partial [Trifolium medium]|nr:hypothetical protein [Trifolium medium]